eukprot:TRINITY_DN15459_c0_g3_i1.p1 TRINITY_DN15459_c0_g3~~TRINITY_DN15459_c0_g3_i1.p1  ORF type:complete len:109 (+),score=34.72 TRINITY_DN15459_c0_g3_i1:3-329(+)
MHLSAAVEKAQSLDPDKIVATMRDLKIESLLGELKLIGKDNPLLPGYGINNQYTSPLPVTVLKDGKPVIYQQRSRGHQRCFSVLSAGAPAKGRRLIQIPDFKGKRLTT